MAPIKQLPEPVLGLGPVGGWPQGEPADLSAWVTPAEPSDLTHGLVSKAPLSEGPCLVEAALQPTDDHVNVITTLDPYSLHHHYHHPNHFHPPSC